MSTIPNYADKTVDDDGSKLERNKVKYATIKTDLTNPIRDFIQDNLEQSNFSATAAPVSTTHHAGTSYGVGSLWVDETNDIAYINVDATTSNGIWRKLSLTGQTLNDAAPSANGEIRARGVAATGLELTGQGSSNDLTIRNKDENSVIRIVTGTRNLGITAGNLIIESSGNGIDFSATSDAGGMTSELFDDYEEGDWTPVLSDGTNDATLSSNEATYTKSGRTVFVSTDIVTSSLGSMSGDSEVQGLPYTVSATQYGQVANVGFSAGLNIAAGESVAGTFSAGNQKINLYTWDVTTGTTAMQASEISADGRMHISGTYTT